MQKLAPLCPSVPLCVPFPQVQSCASEQDRLLYSGESAFDHAIPNSLLIAKPGSDFFPFCMELMAKTFEEEKSRPWNVRGKQLWTVPEVLTGPVMLKRCLSSYKGVSRIKLLPRMALYPVAWPAQRCGLGFAEDIDTAEKFRNLSREIDRKRKVLAEHESNKQTLQDAMAVRNDTMLRKSWAITYWSHIWEAAPKAVANNPDSISKAVAGAGAAGQDPGPPLSKKEH